MGASTPLYGATLEKDLVTLDMRMMQGTGELGSESGERGQAQDSLSGPSSGSAPDLGFQDHRAGAPRRKSGPSGLEMSSVWGPQVGGRGLQHLTYGLMPFIHP